MCSEFVFQYKEYDKSNLNPQDELIIIIDIF